MDRKQIYKNILSLTYDAREYIERDIARKVLEGWSSDDILKYVSCLESVNPNLPEDLALSRIKDLNLKYYSNGEK